MITTKRSSSNPFGPTVRCAVCDVCESDRTGLIELTVAAVSVVLCERHAREAATELMAAASEAVFRRVVQAD